MQKKKFDLTSDVIDINLEDGRKDQLLSQSKRIKEDEGKGKSVLITISVDEELRKEYKTWCIKNDLKMNEAFLKGFNLLKRNEET